MEDSHPENSGDNSQADKAWYILKATAGRERKISNMLMQRVAFHNLDSLIGEIFIPAEEVTLKRHGKESKRTITYYPGYIILQAEMTDDLWHVIKDVPNISGFVGGTPREPQKISVEELNKIKEQINQGIKQAELYSVFSVGQNVRISEGPFADFNGIVDAVDPEHSKLTVKVSIFGRATPIELDFDKVKST